MTTLACYRQRGFTIIELLIAAFILALTFGLVVTMAVTGRSKSLLENETTKLTTAIEYTRQQSLAAYQGQEYSIVIKPDNTFTILPENTTKKLRVNVLDPGVPTQITFHKITGLTDSEHQITLGSGNLETTITISPQGQITSTPITTP